MKTIWRRVGLAVSAVGILAAAFVFLVVGAQAGSGIDPDGSALRDAQDQVSLPADTRAAPAAQAAAAAFDAVAGQAGVASVWTIPSPAYKIYITADGIYRLSYSYLAALLPVDTLDPRTFRMFYMGQEIAIRVIGEEDGSFDATDAVVFYARSVDAMYSEGLTPINKYTGTNVYWLTYGGSPGLRMTLQDGSGAGNAPDLFLHTEHLEFNLNKVGLALYWSSLPMQPDAEHWYRDWVSDEQGRSYAFTAPNAAGDPYSATFTARLLSTNTGPHRVSFGLNGNLLLDATLGSDFGVFQTSVQVPQGYLTATNAITVAVSNPGDKIYLDWMKLLYYDRYVAESNRLAFSAPAAGAWRYGVTQFSTADIEVYDVSNLMAPRMISNTAISGSGPYAVEFSAAATGDGRYVALTSAARQTPAGIEKVVPLASAYTPLDLLLPTQGADYIIITHRDFFAQALRLADHRAPQFARIKVIDVQSIYDQFNGGLMSAEAIRDFLRYARATWIQPAPSYVALMGDGSEDIRRYNGLSSGATYIPPYLAMVDPSLGETASDNRFVMLVGNDVMPDMHIGRLPVNSLAEATAMVDKIIAYEGAQCGCQPGGWRQNLLFVTDNLDTGGDFHAYSDKIVYGWANPPTNTIPLIPDTYTVARAYQGQTCATADACKQTIVNTLNTTGALFVSYVGHSTRSAWAAPSVFDLSSINSLAPRACLPIMLPMTCYEGSFQWAPRTLRVLSESYTRAVGKGAIASFSATGFGLVSGHDLLEEGFFLAIFHEGIDTLGAAATYAKQHLKAEDPYGSHIDLIDTFLVIGDPGLRITTQATCETPTGIALAGFEAQDRGAGVRVSWRTNSEAEVFGFNVLRAVGAGGQPAEADYVAINPTPIVAQLSGSNDGTSYSYDDAPLEFGRPRWYKLELIGLDGSRTLHGPVEVATSPWRVYLPQFSHAAVN